MILAMAAGETGARASGSPQKGRSFLAETGLGEAALARESGAAEKHIREAFARAQHLLPECAFLLATFDCASETHFHTVASERAEAKAIGLVERHAARKGFRDTIAQLADGRGFCDLLNGLEPGLTAFSRPVSAVTFAQPVMGDVCAMLAVWKPLEYGLFSPPDHGFVVEMAQFVFSLLRLRMAVAAAATADLSENLSRLDVGFLAVDLSLRIVHANRAAERLLEDGEYILRSGEGISLSDEAADVRLKQLVEHFAGRRKDDAGAIAMKKPSGGNDLVRLMVTVLRDTADALLGPPLFALSFAPEKHAASVEPADLRRLGLSPAETELALDLLQGRTVTQHAHHRGIAVATARAHLKRAMMRLGVNRQADLIRHLMSVL